MLSGFDRINVWGIELEPRVAHGGTGTIGFRRILEREDAASPLNFIDVADLEPGVSIGLHRHRENEEEFYLVLSGTGTMRRNGEEFRVSAGDLIRNPPGGEHSLVNDGEEAMRLLVFEGSVRS
jgi:mannose-6-phosphate isomerase-like protein (cupin superfamily)